MVGHRVSLTISCPNSTLSNITWSIPGQYVKDYKADNNSGVLTFLDSSDLAKEKVTFCWVQPSAPFTWVVRVTFTRTKEGVATDCEKSVSFVVKGPTVTTYWPTGIGGSVGIPGTDTITMAGGDVPNEGIAFKACVGEPPEYNFGLWQFVQLTAPEIISNTNPPGTCEVWKGSTIQSLDKAFPYPLAATGDTVGPWVANGTTQHWSTDSPFSTFDRTKYSQLNRNDSYVMYLMYQPDAAESIWVAITYCMWSFTYCADVNNGNWRVVVQTNSYSAWPSYYPSNPTWTKRLPQDGAWSATTCPGPCL